MPASQAKRARLGLLIPALVCFFNPQIGIVDLLPDVIGALLFVKLLKHAADLSPYFKEAREAFIKLAVTDLIKFFCQFSVMGRATLGTGDMSAMLSIAFLVLEVIFSFTAIKYLFDGLFYLGERSDAKALYTPFPVLRTTGPHLDPERVKVLSFVFFALKPLLAALPELLRLSRDPMNESASDPSVYYPRAVLLCASLVLVLGILWLYLSLRYLGAIRREGRISDVLRDRLSTQELALYEDRVRRGTFRIAGYELIVSSVFLLTVRLEDYGGINMLPTFLLPLLLLIAFHTVKPYLPVARLGRLVAALTAAVSLAAFTTQAIFFESYSFIDIPNSDRAAALYEAVKWTTLAETLAISGLLLTVLLCLYAFIRGYTVCDEGSRTFTAIDRDERRSLKKSATFTVTLLILTAAARCADVFFRGRVKVIFTNPNLSYSSDTVTTGLFPWFSTVATALTVVTTLVLIFLVSRLREAYLLRYPNADDEA